MLTTFLLGCTFLFIQINEYANIGFAPQDHAQQTIFYSLTGLHGAHVFIGLLILLERHRARLPRALQPRLAPRCGRAGHLLALRRHHVDRRLHDRLHPLAAACLCCNPLRSEGEAFRLLLYVIAVFAVIAVLIVVLRALL